MFTKLLNNKTWHHKQLELKQITSFTELEIVLKKYISSKKTLKEIFYAYIYAQHKHADQKRRDGSPYYYHPLTTAYFLAQMKMGPQTIIAGLLHDILEDTPVTSEELEKAFSKEVADLVSSVTKVSFFAKENRQEQKSDYLRKIYLSMAKDIRVIIIKLCDRLHNMLTIKYLSIEKQKVIAKETLEIYSSIAHRIGMKEIKSLLEDLSFEVLYPNEYKRINNSLNEEQSERIKIINKIITELDFFLRREKHLKILDIYGRSKTIYSIYRKMIQFGRSFEDLKDLLAVRIIARNVDDCYKILGFIHQKYIPIANKFKDYIATPKNGVYQSLHTTLTDNIGNFFEVQIRTPKMEEVAEFGVAAHWAYKEGELIDNLNRQKEIDQQIDIFNRILEIDQQNTEAQNKGEETESIEKVLKDDFFTTLIYVLTPDKKVITLPYGSTVLDFAFRIHSEIGQHTIGAKINGIFTTINTPLKSGQIVEIKTSQKTEPTYEWLKIVKTANARNRIRKYLASKIKEEDNAKDKKTQEKNLIEKVKANFNTYINNHQQDLKWKRRNNEQVLNEIKKLGYNSIDDLFLAIGKGDYNLPEIVDLIFIDQNFSKDDVALQNIKTETKEEMLDFKNEVIVNGIPNLKVQIASCCFPVPKEPISGYVTKSNGIKIHSNICPNINVKSEENRLIDVKWNNSLIKKENNSYTTIIKYYATDRPNLIYDITKLLTSSKANTINATLKTDEKTLLAVGVLKIRIKTYEQLQMIISSMKAIPSIIDVKRAMEN